jgi:hypothetical protein
MNRHHDRHRLRDLRDDRRGYYESRKPARKGQVGKVLAILAVVAVAGLVASRTGCHSAPVAQTLPAKKQLAGLKPKDLQQQTAEYGIEGGAVAGMKIVSAANEPVDITGEAPDPEVSVTTAGFVVKKVRSVRPHVLPADREQAVREAEAEARRVLVEKGYVTANEWKVSYDASKVGYVRPDKSVQDEWEAKGLGTDRGWVEIEEVTLAHDTVRGERAKDRSAQAGFWFGTAFLGLLAAYGFLRLDMWTKGYLTLVLGIVVGAVVVAAVIALAVLVL